MSGLRRVIVGASGSPGNPCALRYAEHLARAADATLIPVCASPRAGSSDPSRELANAVPIPPGPASPAVTGCCGWQIRRPGQPVLRFPGPRMRSLGPGGGAAVRGPSG